MSEKQIERMDFKELRKKVRELHDSLEIFKRQYKDAIENLDYDNFSGVIKKQSEKFVSEFKMTEEEIRMSVSALDGDVSWLAITVDNISLCVESIEGSLSDLSVKADSISSKVTKTITASFESDVDPNYINTTDTQKAILCHYDGDYYYYNDFSCSWEKYDEHTGVGTFFEQTATGFRLVGDVEIDEGSLHVSKIYSTDGGKNYFATMGSEYCDFGLYYQTADIFNDVSNSDCIWGVQQSDLTTRNINMYASGNAFLGYDVDDTTAYAKTTWNFANCDRIVWGNNKPVAVFG